MAAIALSNTITVMVKYLWRKGNAGSYYFRKRIPKDLLSTVKGTGGYVMKCLFTTDLRVAAREVARLDRQTEREWDQQRNPTRTDDIEQGRRLLESYGIDPNNPKDAPEGPRWALEDLFDGQLPQHVREDAHATGPDLDRHLSSAHAAALQMLQGRLEFRISDCRDLYLKLKCDTTQARKTANISFGYVIEAIGDWDIRKVRRSHVTSFVDGLLEGRKGRDPVKTGTVQRYLNALRAAWNVAILENEWGSTVRNPFEKVTIKDQGKDAATRHPFTQAQRKALAESIGNPQDDLRCLLVILSETGARLAEVTGLAVADCHPDAPVPYIHIKEHPWRSLKTSASTRKVPLTFRALGAVRKALELAGDSAYLFSRYTSQQVCNATSASAALNKDIRSRLGAAAPTVHSFRHTIRDLLRHVHCPESAARQLGGWAKQDVSEGYGSGYTLGQLRDWLTEATA